MGMHKVVVDGKCIRWENEEVTIWARKKNGSVEYLVERKDGRMIGRGDGLLFDRVLVQGSTTDSVAAYALWRELRVDVGTVVVKRKQERDDVLMLSGPGFHEAFAEGFREVQRHFRG